MARTLPTLERPWPLPHEEAWQPMIDADPNLVFIEGEVPSSKNSKQRATVGGRPMVIASKATQKYKKHASWLYVRDRDKVRKAINGQFPAKVGMHFFRKTKAKYDHHNLLQIVADMMVKYEHIPDDNIDHMLIFPLRYDGRWTTRCKERPGVLIKILTDETNTDA